MKRSLTLFIVLAVLTACQEPSIGAQTIMPSVMATVTTPTPQALPTQETQGQITTSTPVGMGAGSVILDQVLAIDAAQPSIQSIVFRGQAKLVIMLQAIRQNVDMDFRLSLVDKYGTSLAQVDSVLGTLPETISEITLPYDGDYRLDIAPTAGMGTVQFTATVIERATGGGVFEGLPVQSDGIMAGFGVFHLFQFQVIAGDTISLSVQDRSTGSMELSLMLIGPDGREVASGNSTLEGLIVPTTGTYQAVVANTRGEAGEYVFNVWSELMLPTPGDAADIGYDQEYRAVFADQSALSVSFDGTIGDILRVDIVAPTPDLNLDIYIYSPYEHIIAFAAEGALNEMQLPYTGRYRLELRPTGSGEAAFIVTRLASDQLSGGGVFGYVNSEKRSGEISAANVFHYYQFSGAPSDVIDIFVELPEDSDLELVVVLLGPSGQEIVFVESDDQRAFGLASLELRQSGTYTILVYSGNGSQGLYDLVFERQLE